MLAAVALTASSAVLQLLQRPEAAASRSLTECNIYVWKVGNVFLILSTYISNISSFGDKTTMDYKNERIHSLLSQYTQVIYI